MGSNTQINNSDQSSLRLCITLSFAQKFLSKFCPTNPTGSCTNDLEDVRVSCTATVETHGQTGVEMEALTAEKLLEKHGGKSGSFVAQAQ